ncbi:MAG: 30S ribosomal protein S1, partial [Muribaculaceae bacterium]|nr:30S ribosomal protein S1 [Muribaculaceae bacterium]
MSEELKNSPIADLDWEAFERGETQRDKSYEELEKTYDKSLGSFRDKEVTEGTVISINKREVVVKIGAKSEG